ncbi:acetylcholine receptor subunit alpha-like 1 [Paramacrobiotus metropolitanus]|uniref:acetylcholine receptor subunit alpha-like 1 n=1 Tax=Paramacrobiotus metropolitanus TaxID=2943436 RepID=UPI002446234C|nr:acetylcholine receptor subunit alpha-like 1 [Paramacrobiotus metropolitanus]
MELGVVAVILWLLPIFAGYTVEASPDAERLFTFLMRDYNKFVRPVNETRNPLKLRLSLKLMQLIGVDEVNQVITTSVIARQTWQDYKLMWNPEEFGGITRLDIPGDQIWLPDLVLYNNADGNYQITLVSKVKVNYTGHIEWEPPVIYKSYCQIDVRYFPYDKQNCTLKFGSWTYDQTLVDLEPERDYVGDALRIQYGMDLSEFKRSIEWDVMQTQAWRDRVVYSYGPYVDIKFEFIIRRKPLFYTVNLMIPCVLISFLTVFVFYLPCDSGEKVTLCISILLSLTVFVLLLAEIIPPTSLAVPLMGRYLLFTMVMVTCSIVFTIIVINIHFRNPATHNINPVIRAIFIDYLPKLLLIERPTMKDGEDTEHETAAERDYERERQRRFLLQQPGLLGFASPRRKDNIELNRDARKAIDGINFLVEHVRETHNFANIVKDWKYIAMVLDRLFLWMFAAACLIGTGTLILDSPELYDYSSEPIPKRCDIPGPIKYDKWICFVPEEDDITY